MVVLQHPSACLLATGQYGCTSCSAALGTASQKPSLAMQSPERKCHPSSKAGFSWGHRLPAKVQAAAGIAAEVNHEEYQRQNKQEQRLPQSPVPSPLPGSTVTHAQHTGAFARLPMVPVSTEIIESALKRAGRVAANKKLKNEAQKARSRYITPKTTDIAVEDIHALQLWYNAGSCDSTCSPCYMFSRSRIVSCVIDCPSKCMCTSQTTLKPTFMTERMSTVPAALIELWSW